MEGAAVRCTILNWMRVCAFFPSFFLLLSKRYEYFFRVKKKRLVYIYMHCEGRRHVRLSYFLSCAIVVIMIVSFTSLGGIQVKYIFFLFSLFYFIFCLCLCVSVFFFFF